jgi:Tol biopolymer transport system component
MQCRRTVPSSTSRQHTRKRLDRSCGSTRGAETQITAPLRMYAEPRLSPDGTRVALTITDSDTDIWIWDLAQEMLTRLTFDPSVDQNPIWTPDGQRIVFASQRGGAFNLFAQAADGTGPVERLTLGANQQTPGFVAPDRTGVVGVEVSPKTGSDIVWFPRTIRTGPSRSGEASSSSPALVKPLIQTSFIEHNPEISPDWRFIAYQSNEAGPPEIYVRPFPEVNAGRWQLSTGGGTRPAWSRDGRELFYLDPAGTLVSTPVQTSGSTFVFGNSVRLFDTKNGLAYESRDYDVAPDGRRFLMVKENPSADRKPPTRMIVILNWQEELKQRVPTK